MTPRGLKQLTNAANRIEARAQWEDVAKAALANGHADLVDLYRPLSFASWRKVDQMRHMLEAAIAKRQKQEPAA